MRKRQCTLRAEEECMKQQHVIFQQHSCVVIENTCNQQKNGKSEPDTGEIQQN